MKRTKADANRTDGRIGYDGYGEGKRMNKKRKKWWLPILAILVLTVVAGCVRVGLSKEEIAKRGLKAKYNEKFVVHEISGTGLDWEATVSPVNSPELVFKASFFSDGTVERDGYFRAYVGHLMEEILKNDLYRFYPDSFIRVDSVGLNWEGNATQDFREMNLEETLASSSRFEGSYSGCFVDIFINKDVGSRGNYEEEYYYFTNTIDEYIEEKKMIPLKIVFYKTDTETINRLEEYFKKDIDNDSIYAQVLGVEYFELGIHTKNGIDLGNPPNISACFDKDEDGFIGEFSEYKRRRELLENAK